MPPKRIRVCDPAEIPDEVRDYRKYCLQCIAFGRPGSKRNAWGILVLGLAEKVFFEATDRAAPALWLARRILDKFHWVNNNLEDAVDSEDSMT